MFGECPTYSPTVDSELPQLDLWSLLCTADAALPFTPGARPKVPAPSVLMTSAP